MKRIGNCVNTNVLAILTVIVFVMIPGAAPAQPPTRPPTPVIVENPSDNPVPVAGTVEVGGVVNVNNADRVTQTAIQVTRGFNFSSGLSASGVIVQVPADKFLVVQYASLQLALPSGQTPITAELNGGLNSQDIVPTPEPSAAPHALVPLIIGSLSGQDLFNASQKMEMFVQPSTNLGFQISRSSTDDAAFASGRITISGRLIDCSSGPPCPLP